jgi:hypothetical protein
MMDKKEFRKQGHAFVDWMADYLDDVEKLPVKSSVKPGLKVYKLMNDKGRGRACYFVGGR